MPYRTLMGSLLATGTWISLKGRLGRLLRLCPRAALPLSAVLLVQSVASLGLRNTAFRDEALYLWAGRQILHYWQGGPPNETFENYFSGLPYFYPVIGGLLDALGGLEAARLFSLCCMLWVTIAVYRCTKQLYGSASAILSAALFACQSSVLFLGHFATYDAFCLALLALATVVALRTNARQGMLSGVRVGGLLMLAGAAKYAAILFVPVVLFLLVWRVRQTTDWKRGFSAVGAAIGTFTVGVLVLLVLDGDLLAGLSRTTTSRHILGPAPRLVLAEQTVWLEGIFIVLAALGLTVRPRGVHWPLSLMLFGSLLLAPAYHIYKTEYIALQKHIAFGLFFASPLFGRAAMPLMNSAAQGLLLRRLRWGAVPAAYLAMLAMGFHQADQYYHQWPNSSGYVLALRRLIQPGDQILAEVVEVPRYYLQNEVSATQWSNFAWFEYKDSRGRLLRGQEAYQTAIAAGYFDVVLLHYDTDAAVDHAIDKGLNSGEHYRLVVQQPYSWIWRKKSMAARPVDSVGFLYKIKARTMDELRLNDQQSEKDHDLKSENSCAGIASGCLRWHDATEGS